MAPRLPGCHLSVVPRHHLVEEGVACPFIEVDLVVNPPRCQLPLQGLYPLQRDARVLDPEGPEDGGMDAVQPFRQGATSVEHGGCPELGVANGRIEAQGPPHAEADGPHRSTRHRRQRLQKADRAIEVLLRPVHLHRHAELPGLLQIDRLRAVVQVWGQDGIPLPRKPPGDAPDVLVEAKHLLDHHDARHSVVHFRERQIPGGHLPVDGKGHVLGYAKLWHGRLLVK